MKFEQFSFEFAFDIFDLIKRARCRAARSFKHARERNEHALRLRNGIFFARRARSGSSCRSGRSFRVTHHCNVLRQCALEVAQRDVLLIEQLFNALAKLRDRRKHKTKEL